MSVNIGNAGEHLIMAELLFQGFDAYMADRGNPAYDIACVHNPTGRMTRIRVKTSSNHSAVWNAKKSGHIFLDMNPENDFVVIANLGNGLRERDVYIVPTPIVANHLIGDFDHYVSFLGRGGKPRSTDSSMRRIHFNGEDRPDNSGYGYAKKFAQYLEAWELLK